MGYIDAQTEEQIRAAAAGARLKDQHGQAAIALAILALAQALRGGRL